MNEQSSTIKSIERSVDDLSGIRHRKPWLFYLILIGFLIFAGAWLFDKFWGIPSLNKKIEEQRGQIQLLETQLTPFRTIALERFSGTEAEALAKLAFQLNELESAVSTLQNYSTIATLDMQGNPPGFGPGSVIETHTPLTDLLRDCYTNLPGGRVQVICSPETEKKFLEAVDKFPDFPFSYYALAYCYQKEGRTNWQEYAIKALAILDKTTTIKNHNPQHDEVRSKLKQALGR
jgi:hypothetical protein